MKISAFITVIILLSVSCISGGFDNNSMPEEVETILEMSQQSPDYLNLSIEILKAESDSVFVNLSFINSSNTNPVDTLYHSSSFPQLIAFKEGILLTRPIEEQIFFDDLNSTMIHKNTANIRTYGMKRLTGAPYKIVAVFRYRQRVNDRDDLWLVSEPLLVN